MRRSVVGVVALSMGLFVGGLLAGCDNSGEAKAPAAAKAPPLPEVTVETITKQALPVQWTYGGRTEGFREVEVRAQVQGILLKRTYDEGAKVKQGELLFEIDPRPYQAALAQAKARLADAEARERAADRALKRAKELIRTKAISRSSLDQAQADYDVAVAGVALQQAAVQAAQIDVDHTTVEAPISGITGEAVPSVGSLVGPGANSLLTHITEVDPIYVNFAYPDTDWLRQRDLLAKGQVGADGLVAELHFADGTVYSRKGRIDFTAARVDQQTGTVAARAVFPNPDGTVLPGQFVRIVLKGLVRKNVIAIPQAAVMQGAQGTYVYRVSDKNTAEVTPVVTGDTEGLNWIVTSGLAPGDRIITEGIIHVRPGQTVKVAGEGAPSGKTPAASGAPKQPQGQSGKGEPDKGKAGAEAAAHPRKEAAAQ